MIWIGTDGNGLSRFDGQNFINYNSSDGLVNNSIKCITELSNDYIAIGTSSGVSLFNGHSFQTLDNNLNINDILESNSNSLWFASDKGLIKYNDGVLHVPAYFEKLKDKKVSSLISFDNGLLIGTDSGLYHFDGLHRRGQFHCRCGISADGSMAGIRFLRTGRSADLVGPEAELS